MASQSQTLTFRCPPELDGWLPPPRPAVQGLPDWLRTMPQRAFSPLAGADDDTVKRCPPFVDAMTAGFLIPLMCDLRVENGEFSWEEDMPASRSVNFVRSPLGLHDAAQVAGTPLAAEDRFLLKFHNLWTIEAPDGYALMFTHPVNRFDLPFTTFTGLVDSDRYHQTWIHFPAQWRDEGFSGVLPKGTPIAQCFPVRRETWSARIETQGEAQAQAAHDLMSDIARESGVYRRRFRA